MAACAGRRKDDGSGDFYREIAKFGNDSTPIAPTAEDLRYLKFEAAYIAECALDRNAHTAIVEAVLAAAADPGHVQRTEVFGARVGVTVDADPGDEMLSVSFDFVSFEERDRFPVDVLAFVPDYESLEDWDVMPALRPSDPETWFTYVSRSWIAYPATAVELDALLEDGAAPTGASVERLIAPSARSSGTSAPGDAVVRRRSRDHGVVRRPVRRSP